MSDEREPAGAAPAATPPPQIGHAMSAARIQSDRATRVLNTIVGSAKLAAGGLTPSDLDELSQLQAAVVARMQTMTGGWARAWEDWYRYAADARGVNTMSKLAVRETNIVSQLTRMIGAQLTDLINLQENIEVNYAYWLTQKLADKP